MGQGKRILSTILRVAIFMVVAAAVTACAGRPKQVNPTRPFNVSEVRVTTQSMADFRFADRLKRRLDASVGRATVDTGIKAVLRIVVLDRSAEAAKAGVFARNVEAATLDLAVLDATTGQVLRSSLVHAAAPSEASVIGKLTSNVRVLLGLSGVSPQKVGGAKRYAAAPKFRPDPAATEEETAVDLAPISADPLLNGTVTPTTVNVDEVPEARPAIDLTRPLLSAEPDPVEDETEEVIAPAEPVNMPRTFQLPATPPTIEPAPTPARAAAADEPCIITLDNDCGDPDG